MLNQFVVIMSLFNMVMNKAHTFKPATDEVCLSI